HTHDAGGPTRDLTTFPTRRSSDLVRAHEQKAWSMREADGNHRVLTLTEKAMGCVYCFRVGSENCFKVGRTKNPQSQLGSNRHIRSEEHTSELQSRVDLVCRLLLDK